MIKTYKILSALLTYPDEELKDFFPVALTELENEALLSPEKTSNIRAFTEYALRLELESWQADYVQLFDYSRKASLYLFEHIKGESKDRGQAMVDLLGMYQEGGLELSANELPDFVPVFLEFLSQQDKTKAADLLNSTITVISRIHQALNKIEHPYSFVFDAILEMASVSGSAHYSLPIDKEEQETIDEEYEKDIVRFDDYKGFPDCNQ